MKQPGVLLSLLLAFVLAGQLSLVPSASAAESETPHSYVLDDSIKNGEELQVFLEAKDRDFTEVSLAIDGTSVRFPLMETETSGFWRGSWTAVGLATEQYTTTFTATDRTGITHTFAGPSFSDPVFGITAAGTTAYTDGQMRERRSTNLRPATYGAVNFQVHEASGYGYVISPYWNNGSDAALIKFSLTDVTDVTALTFPTDPGWSQASRLTSDGAYFLYLPYDVNKNAYKVRTADMTIEDTLFLASPLGYTEDAMLDEGGDALYLALGDGAGGFITKVQLSTFDIQSTLNLAPDERYPSTLFLNPVTNKIYVGFINGPGRLVEIDRATFTRGATFNYANPELSTGLMLTGHPTPIGGYFYASTFAGGGNPGHMVKFDATTLAVNAILPMGALERSPFAFSYDGANTLYLLGNDTAVGHAYIRSLNLTTFTLNPAKINQNNGDYRSLHYSQTEGALLFAKADSTDNLGNMTLKRFHPTTLAEVDSDPFPLEDAYVQDFVADTEAGIGYALHYEYPATISRTNLDTGARIDTLVLSAPGSLNVNGSRLFLDKTNDQLYVGLYDSNPVNNDFVYVISLTNFTETAVINVGANRNPFLAAVDPSGETLYYIAQEGGGLKRLTINLNSQTFVGASNISASYTMASYITYDSVNNRLYGVLYNNVLGRYEAVEMLTSGTIIQTVTLGATESVDRAVAVNWTNRTMYVTTNEAPSKVIAIDLDTMTRGTTLTLGAGNDTAKAMSIDEANQLGFILTDTTPVRLVKVNLATMTELGMQSMDARHKFPTSIAYDGVRGNVYTAHDAVGTRIVTTAISHKGSLWATKVNLASPATNIAQMRWYSHAAAGNVRLALYNSSKNLVWQSGVIPNTSAGGWVRAAISGGTPSSLASLPAGVYWLAFQTDSNQPVASFSTGAAASGFFLAQDFGTFPASVAGETLTTQNYAINVVYDTGFSVTQTGGSTVITEGVPTIRTALC